ncbi:MAG: ribosome maturation factor RimM [Myxococcaceae bacterium]
MGYVARAHGLDGEVGVKTFDPASNALMEVEGVRLKLRDGTELELTIDSVRDTQKELLVCFEGVERRAEAERLVGSTVLVDRAKLVEPEEGEFFQGDLVGLTAVNEQGETLGTVAEIWNTGPVPNLVIRAKGKPELLIPFADEFIPDVDLNAGKLIVRPPLYDDAGS